MSKAKNAIWIILMIIPSIVIILSGIMKILKVDQVVQQMTQHGFGNYLPLMAISEFIFVALFLYPKTYKIGFLFFTCYLAGAMALEISGGRFPVMAIFLTMIWISVFLRNKSMFINA